MNALQEILAQTNLSCLFLLSLAAFLSSAADRLLQLKLGAISVFLAPAGDNLGAGVTYMLLPITLLLVPIAIFFNDPQKRLKYLQAAMLIKAAMALVLSLDLVREFLSQGGPRVGYSLSLIFLAGEWTVICMVVYLRQRAPRPLVYLSALAAAYFSGQTLALVLAPYVVSQPFSNTFAACCGTLYAIAFYAAKICQHRSLVQPLNHSLEHSLNQSLENSLVHSLAQGESKSTEPGVAPRPELVAPVMRLLAATVILYTPLYICLMLSLFYAIQGYQAGTLPFAGLAAKAAVAVALGACASIFLHHIAGRRRVLQTVALTTICLAAAGGLTYSYDTSLFTLLAVTGMAGFVAPDWENHLLSVLPVKALAPFFAARNTIVMLLIAALSPTVERTLAAVSALYVLKELNILVLLSALLAVLLAPIILARRPKQVHLSAHEDHAEAGLVTMSVSGSV